MRDDIEQVMPSTTPWVIASTSSLTLVRREPLEEHKEYVEPLVRWRDKASHGGVELEGDRGHSIMCHPLLNSVNHSQWKVKMKFFVQAFDYDAWRIITRGPLEVPKRKRWDANDKENAQLNFKANSESNFYVMHILLCAMREEVFKKFSSRGIFKDICDRLEEIYGDKKEENETKKPYEKESMTRDEERKYEQPSESPPKIQR
ncbi:hypothetical protein Golax_003561 [Gossypium laxum]|uniref:Uncharacterized protein n=1 Tax=Gossypium laxum TaxID=34288 RepID=A0A7J9AFS6_9ROSI|nr:hypothetical protein [Gossypium laxum]